MLPTREMCKNIVSKSDAFFCTTTEVEGQVVEMYNYRLANHADFFPKDGSNWSELRGLTFIQNLDGTWQRNILLQKFFNINQTTNWMYDDVKNKKITRIQNKEDGALSSHLSDLLTEIYVLNLRCHLYPLKLKWHKKYL